MSRILVVDDDHINARIIKQILEREGYEAMECYSGEDAVALIEQSVFDLVLLDIMMPGMDGYDVCKIIKARERFIPVIMITALEHIDDKIKGLDHGADDFLSKPFDRYELVARVRTLIKLKRSFDQLEDNYNQIKYQMGLARAIQETIAMPERLRYEGIDILSYTYYAGDVSGDFLDVQVLDDGRIALFLADSVGHGVSAALVSFMLRSLYLGLQGQGSVGDIMQALNNRICHVLGSNEMGLYCTAILLILDGTGNKATYASAGHPPIVIESKGELSILEHSKGGLPLGLIKDHQYSCDSIEGFDKLSLYTDGISDRIGYGDDNIVDYFHKAFSTWDIVAGLPKSSIPDEDDTTIVIINTKGGVENG